jgi:hypothetical protein
MGNQNTVSNCKENLCSKKYLVIFNTTYFEQKILQGEMWGIVKGWRFLE